jgi:hypothetical protein
MKAFTFNKFPLEPNIWLSTYYLFIFRTHIALESASTESDTEVPTKPAKPVRASRQDKEWA